MRFPIAFAATVAAACGLMAPSVASASYAGAVDQDGPTAFYELNESGGPVAADASGHGLAGTYSGGVTYGVPAPFADAGTAVTLDGTGKVTSTLPGGTSIQTIELWVKPTARAPQTLVTHGNAWSLEIAGNGGPGLPSSAKRKLILRVGSTVLNSRMALPAGAWSMIDVVLDPAANRVRFYLNGGAVEKDATPPAGFTFPAAPSNQTLQIGPGASNAKPTSFDEVALYPTMLSLAQIKAHFSASPLPDLATAPTLSPLTGVKVGDTLHFVQGIYQSGTAVSVSDVWLRCNDAITDPSTPPCVAIAPASAMSAYTLQDLDAGYTIMVEETATNAFGTLVTDTSETDAVAKADGTQPPAPTGVPPSGDNGHPPVDETPATTPGTGAGGVLSNQNSCVAHFASVKTRIARIGKRALRLSFATKTRTLRLSAPRRTVRTVTYRLDGKVLRVGKKAPFGAAIALKGLKLGAHTLKATVKLRTGKTRTLTLRLNLRGC